MLQLALLGQGRTRPESRVFHVNNNFTVDSANSSFSVTLLPGESASFSALQEQRGGVFADGSYSASLDAFLRVASVVPESGSLPMMSLGLLALALTQRHRRRRG